MIKMSRGEATVAVMAARCAPISKLAFSREERVGKPRPNSACPMGARGKGAGLTAAVQQRNSLPIVSTTATTRRVSFPLLPSHAMLGSQMSREASKSFWSQEMLRDMERKIKDESNKLPPLHQQQQRAGHYSSSSADTSRSRKTSYDRHQSGLYLSSNMYPSVTSSSYHRSKTQPPSHNNVPSLQA